MNISIKVIPHSEQRYPTCGDWFWSEDMKDLEIRVSKMTSWKHECLVAFHELCEVLICKHLGISQSEVDNFDMDFEEDRDKGLHSYNEEPGDHKLAPYRTAHFIATNCERILALALGVDWYDYEHEVVIL